VLQGPYLPRTCWQIELDQVSINPADESTLIRWIHAVKTRETTVYVLIFFVSDARQEMRITG
jgi:hypothetical protein